jgi:hypothetical protein
MENEFVPPFIDVPVRPLLKGGVLFQRITRWLETSPRQDPDSGALVVEVKVQVRHFLTNADGTPGADASELVPHEVLTYSALNTEAVDVATGEVVYTRLKQTAAEWHQLLADDPRTLMPRGNAYGMQLHAGPVDLVPQIRAAMQAADGPPWYRFGGRPEGEAPPVVQ